MYEFLNPNFLKILFRKFRTKILHFLNREKILILFLKYKLITITIKLLIYNII